MAGFSNVKFLAPSHFTKSEGNSEEKSFKNPQRNVLLPPSTYENVGRNDSRKDAEEKLSEEVVSLERENLELRQTIDRLFKEIRHMKSQVVTQRSRREESLESKLHLAKRMVGDLEQEKEILKYELEDRVALSDVVLKLKKELKKAREKLSSRDKAMVEKTQEYSETVRRLRRELETAESAYLEETSRLNEKCSELEEDIKELNEKNGKLREEVAVKELKFELMCREKEEENKETVEKFNKQLLEQDEISKNKLDSFGEDFKRIKEHNKRLETELLQEKNMCRQLENEVSLKELTIAELQDNIKTKEGDLKQLDVEYNNRVTALETECGLNVRKLEETIQSKNDILHKEHQMYKEELQQKDDEIKELVRSVEQLRSYIGEIRPSQETQKLNEVNSQLTNTVKVLTEENDTLHATAKLLNVRLSSILEIVAIQETEMTTNVDLVGNSGDSQTLLKKWREKVFALMVQLHSQKIVESDQKRKENVEHNSLKAKLEDLEREHSVLSHKLADKEAALELEINLGRTKSQELEKLKDENKVLKNKQNASLTQFQSLCSSLQAVEKTLLHSLSNLNRAINKMSSFDERIKFAGSRVHFISEFLIHRDSQLKPKSSVCKNSSSEGDASSDVDSSRSGEPHLKEEIEKLLKERAVLLNETKKHNETLQEKTLLITQEYETVIEQKNERIEKLEMSEVEMKEKLRVLQDSLETKSRELTEVLESIEELRLTLTKQKATIEKAHREAFEKERLRNLEIMTSLEGQLNDVRREHTKAVAALKNAERRVSREKDQSAKMVSNIELEFTEKLARLQTQLKKAEKERNLLMVRIREDNKNISRLRPLPGDQNIVQKNGFPLTKKAAMQANNQPRRSQLSVTTDGTKTAGDVGDSEEQENIGPIDPNEALIALKDLKVLSEQIVKLREDNENSISDAEY